MPATSFYQPRPVPHFSTSLPQSTVSKDVIRPNDSHPVPLHPNLALSSNHAPRFVSNGYNSTPRDVPSDMVAKDGVDRCNKSLVAQHLKGPTSPPVPAMEPNLYNKVSPVLKIQDVGHSRISNVAPHMGNQSATTQHPSSEMDPNGKPILLSNGKVIQAGKRCGTVQYWRSSLQMPRVAVDINASSKGEISNTKKEMTIGTEFRSNHILKKGDSAQYGSQEESSVDVSARDIRIGRTGAELHKVGDSGNQHAFWRNATKLPRAVFDESRLKRLTSGRRKMNCSNLQHVEGGKDELGAYYDATKEAVADVDFNGDSGYAQGMLVDNRSGSTTECPMNEKAFQREARSLPEDDEYETRRLNLTREYELKRLRSLAQGKFSVKMNLRGRTKLESWLGSSVVTVKSTELIVVMFQLDNRVLSSRPEDRREALLNMENEDLRILEALMLRVTNRGGNANWLLLTGNFNTNNFEDKNNLEWRRKARMT